MHNKHCGRCLLIEAIFLSGFALCACTATEQPTALVISSATNSTLNTTAITTDSAASQPDATSTPQPGEPSVQVIEMTSAPTYTSTVTQNQPTPSAQASTAAPTAIVVAQPTAESTLPTDPTLMSKDFPYSLVQIEEPGELACLVSPITVRAGVMPGDGRLVSVQLYGENGRLMASQLLKMVQSKSGWVNLVTDIDFEITSAGESALVVVSTQDEYGRRIAQSAVPVVLLQIGDSKDEKDNFTRQAFVVDSVAAEGIVKGGVLHLTGYAHPFNSNPIIIELVTQTGGVMESKAVPLPKIAEDQDYAAFTADIPYTVAQRTPIRLTIRQRSTLLPAIDIALSSQLIYLDP